MNKFKEELLSKHAFKRVAPDIYLIGDVKITFATGFGKDFIYIRTLHWGTGFPWKEIDTYNIEKDNFSLWVGGCYFDVSL